MAELFNVVQIFEDGTNEYVRRYVGAEEAVKATKHYTNSVGARLGFVKEVMITDMLDCCVLHWKQGEGIVHPPMKMERQSPKNAE